jgi:hypothetical protein
MAIAIVISIPIVNRTPAFLLLFEMQPSNVSTVCVHFQVHILCQPVYHLCVVTIHGANHKRKFGGISEGGVSIICLLHL